MKENNPIAVRLEPEMASESVFLAYQISIAIANPDAEPATCNVQLKSETCELRPFLSYPW
jgi:hypothetical protein